jgi:hypothetical protein
VRIPPIRRIVFVVLACSAALCSASAHAWFGPSEKEPYLITDAPALVDPAQPQTWVWADARSSVEQDNRPTANGYWFGDAVFKPRPYDFVQAEFLRQVYAHEGRDELLEKLKGKTVRLLEMEAGVGLWVRLNERQSGKWEMVRVRIAIDVDGSRYEASDMHRFAFREKPSPVSVPMRAAVSSLLNQILLF